jgi:hypothetical protein
MMRRSLLTSLFVVIATTASAATPPVNPGGCGRLYEPAVESCGRIAQ